MAKYGVWFKGRVTPKVVNSDSRSGAISAARNSSTAGKDKGVDRAKLLKGTQLKAANAGRWVGRDKGDNRKSAYRNHGRNKKAEGGPIPAKRAGIYADGRHIKNPDGTISTHRMFSGEMTDDRGNPIYFAAPSIMPNEDGKLQEYGDGREAIDRAKELGEFYTFPTDERAKSWAAGDYKYESSYPDAAAMQQDNTRTITPALLAGGGSIYIKPENRGKFTAKANRAGMSVQGYARKVLSAPEGRYDPSTRKQANFARNFGNKSLGGGLEGVLDIMSKISKANSDPVGSIVNDVSPVDQAIEETSQESQEMALGGYSNGDDKKKKRKQKRAERKRRRAEKRKEREMRQADKEMQSEIYRALERRFKMPPGYIDRPTYPAPGIQHYAYGGNMLGHGGHMGRKGTDSYESGQAISPENHMEYRYRNYQPKGHSDAYYGPYLTAKMKHMGTYDSKRHSAPNTRPAFDSTTVAKGFADGGPLNGDPPGIELPEGYTYQGADGKIPYRVLDPNGDVDYYRTFAYHGLYDPNEFTEGQFLDQFRNTETRSQLMDPYLQILSERFPGHFNLGRQGTKVAGVAPMQDTETGQSFDEWFSHQLEIGNEGTTQMYEGRPILIVTGGSGSNKSKVQTHEYYDPETGTYRKTKKEISRAMGGATTNSAEWYQDPSNIERVEQAMKMGLPEVEVMNPSTGQPMMISVEEAIAVIQDLMQNTYQENPTPQQAGAPMMAQGGPIDGIKEGVRDFFSGADDFYRRNVPLYDKARNLIDQGANNFFGPLRHGISPYYNPYSPAMPLKSKKKPEAAYGGDLYKAYGTLGGMVSPVNKYNPFSSGGSGNYDVRFSGGGAMGDKRVSISISPDKKKNE